MAGLGDLFSSLIGGLGKAANAGAGAIGQGVGAIGRGASSLFNSFGSGMQGNPMGQASNMATQGAKTATSGASGGGFMNGLNNAFSSNNAIGTGLGSLFASQLIKNPQMPKLPDSFNQFQQQANAGGPPIQQQSNQYLQTLLSGQNTDANDAATHSLDLNYEEQLRQLNGMYKSLRPGTDPMSDTTYQRDLQNLNDAHARQRAQVLAQQQLGAAQQGIGAGQAQASQQAQAMQTQVDMIANQYQMDYTQKEQLRNMLMGLGGGVANAGVLSKLFPNANPYATRGY